MKNLKLLLLAFVLSFSTGSFAHSGPKYLNENSVTSDIAKFLKESNCDAGEELKVTVFFSVSEDKKIQSVSVASPNREINQLLEKKLALQELNGRSWRMGKVYELSVVQRSERS